MAALLTHTALESTNVLTHAEAQARGGIVSDIGYDLRLELSAGDSYRGALKMTFALSSVPADGVFIDFTGEEVHALLVNGSAADVSAVSWANHRLTLGAALLRAGPNAVELTYANKFDTDGAGLHRFEDPEDGLPYVYTNLEPFDCHRWLPCFDQPDLKARLTLVATAPASWMVASNALCTASEASPGDTKTWTFEEGPLLSTYLLAIVAGPYHVLVDSTPGGLPLRLLCRQAMAKHLDADAEELFTLTKNGLEFYGEFYGEHAPYPFTKYDSAFVPEFNEGAMENAGLVTFTEGYLYRDTPTQSQRLSRADTLLHEMAHMWFGDLTTPVWWVDLWLNESFATYMAALAVASATRFGAASWVQFNNGMKAWAYREDQLSTTHPIAPESAADTDSAFASFDGVTYGKGAAVLKQLVAVIGLDAFTAGVREFFKRHSWGNASLADFLDALNSATSASTFNAQAWADIWLRTAGVNTLRPEFTVDAGGALSSFVVHQTAPPEHPTLRAHTITVAAFNAAGGVLFEERVVVAAEAVTEVTALVGRHVPDLAFVYANHGDHAYAKMELDPLSLAFAQSSVSPATLPSPLSRQLFWRDLYDMTRDAKLSAVEFLGIAREGLGKETDPELLSGILRDSNRALHSLVPNAMYEDEATAMFDAALSQLLAVDASHADAQLVWARQLVSSAQTPATVSQLVDMVAGDAGGVLASDQGLRWSIALKAVSHGVPGAAAALETEKERDGATDRGARHLEQARVCVSDADVKAAAWAEFTAEDADKKKSLHLTASAMAGFHHRTNPALTAAYTAAFFEAVPTVFAKRSKHFAGTFFFSLMPRTGDDDTLLERCKALLAAVDDTDANALLVRNVKEQIDFLNRVLKCRAVVLSKL